MIALSRNVGHVGPYTERYCSGTCFFFRLRQNCRYQMFFYLRDISSPFLLLCSAPPPSLSPTSQQFHRSSSHSARCVLETLLLLVASFLESHFFSARLWPLPDNEAGTTAMCFHSPLSSNTNFQERTPRRGAKPATEIVDHQPVIRSTYCTLAHPNGIQTHYFTHLIA